MRYHIDYNHPIILRPDSSIVGVGATLIQKIDGVERPIIFLSEKYTDAASRWSTIEQEAYAIFWSIMKLESYLLGHHFIVETDHRNLIYMADATAPKVVRWRLRLQEFDFQIHHIPGTRNVIADTLSRCYVARKRENLSPKKAFDMVHNSTCGHFGVARTKDALKERNLMWDNCTDEQIAQFIKQCTYCQKADVRQGDMHPALATTSTEELFEYVEVDTIGPLPVDANGNAYVVVVIDRFSRVLELYAEKDATAAAAARSLFQWCCRYGMPREVQSDNGQQYAADLIADLLNLLHISHRFTLPYRPQANGIVERSNKEILRHLRAILFDQRTRDQWSTSLPLVQRIINTTYHSALGTYPLRILYGDAISATSGLLTDWDDLTQTANHEAYGAYVERLNDQLRQVVLASQQFQKEVVAKRLKKSPEVPTTFEVGQYVLVNYPSGPPDKLTPHWKGPMQVARIDKQSYFVRDLLTNKELPVFIDRLKPYNVDDNMTPVEAATADQPDVFVVESILAHKGNPRQPNTLSFKVKWQGFPIANDASDWIPWSETRKLILAKQYLEDRPKLKHLIAKLRPHSEQVFGLPGEPSAIGKS